MVPLVVATGHGVWVDEDTCTLLCVNPQVLPATQFGTRSGWPLGVSGLHINYYQGMPTAARIRMGDSLRMKSSSAFDRTSMEPAKPIELTATGPYTSFDRGTSIM